MNYELTETEERKNIGTAGYIDVETTGFSPIKDEIVEFAISLFQFDRHTGEVKGIIEEYTGLRESAIHIPSGASKVHGITDVDVQGKFLDDKKIIQLINCCEFLVSHNASFDRGFVSRMYPINKSIPWLCSMNGINWYAKGFSSKGLQKLLIAHGIKPQRAHRAGDDVKMSIKLLSLSGTGGRTYLRELLDKLPQKVKRSIKNYNE